MPKQFKLIAAVSLSVNIMAVLLLVYILLEGSGKGGALPYIGDIASETYAMPQETGQDMGQSAGEDTGESVGENNTEKSTGETDIRPPRSPYVDFSYIEENHEILEYDICAEARYDWENTPLEEYLREEMEEDKKVCQEIYIAVPLTIEYFLFDFNDDGLEDYLVCMDGVRYSGSGGNKVKIYVQEEGGSLKEVLSITDRLHVDDGIHACFTVLDEKTDGYYAIVLTTNHILRYDKDTDRYVFHDGE